ncbi:MAG: YCF48-related protein [Dehalococcoidales bacterium]|nr:YCF48-related protein [Dehalococcoidales bacterium]
MNCKQVRELLPLYADGDLDEDRRDAVARHLAGCEECRRRLAVDRELTVKLSQLPAHAATVAVPPTLRQGVMRKIERGERWQPLWRAANMMGNATALVVWLALVGLAIGALTMLGRPIFDPANGTPSATAFPAGQVEGTRTAPPVVQTPSGPSPAASLSAALRSLHMVSPTTGWALAGNEILRTTNGGSLWSNVTPPAVRPTAGPLAHTALAAKFLDANRGWVAAAAETPGVVTVFRTEDGGRTWSGAELPDNVIAGAPILGMYLQFADSNHGWLMIEPDHGMNSSPGVLYATTDGGVTWTEVASVGGEGNLPFGGAVSLHGDGDGWVVGAPVSTINLSLYQTHDGGHTWQQQELQLPSSLSAGSLSVVTPPTFFSPGEKAGILPVTYVPDSLKAIDFVTVIYRTSDGGQTWHSGVPVPEGIATFANPQDGWVWSPEPRDSGSTAPLQGKLLRTHDGGQSWEVAATNVFTGTLNGLDFADQQAGWAYGQGDKAPYLLKTTDGGATWTDLKPTVSSQPVQPANSQTATPPTAATRPCEAADLTGTAWWQGATGSMAGSIVLTNQSSSECLLGGTPSVELTDGEGQALPVSYTTFNTDGKGPRDVALAPGQQASIFFIWRNWCGAAPALPITFRIALPGDRGSIDTSALNDDGTPRDILPRCDAPSAGSTLSVGFFAPVAPQPDISPTSVPPTATASATVVAADPAGAVQALLDYYDAINQQQYERAYGYWQQGGAASGQTLAQFTSGFADTVRTTVLLDQETSRVSGQAQEVVVPARLMSVVNDQSAPEGQSVRRFEGTYTLQSTADGWEIAGANVHAVTDSSEGAPADARDPTTLLDSYASAIDAGNYARAYTYWDQLGKASGQTFAEFAGGFAGTKQVSIELGQAQGDAGAGNLYADVPTLLFAQQSDGTTKTYCGTYTLHRANIPPFDQFGWRIARADIASTSNVQPGSAEAQSLLQNGCQ